ncbi:hypothetical protein [Phormidium sp. CCY1219]|uniref:hypothetical protein n=1 Tax=Phormidium sp. CCY1219 TaxID=2886104 RepID=UPI002D1EC30B|nr:hypothetical protein [Phormidium sp. CCY1219]MEB3831464.1 hypothetical protein [Phormidium sp. CCY1219]
MQRIFAVFGDAKRRAIALLCVLAFIFTLAGTFCGDRPSYAATGLDTKMVKEEYNLDNNNREDRFKSREEAYQEAIEDAQTLEGQEKIYEKNLTQYKQEQAQPGLIEKAKEFVQQGSEKP